MLKLVKLKTKKHGLSGTKPGRLLKNQIEIKTDHWDVREPGFMEADTVAIVEIVWLEILFGASH